MSDFSRRALLRSLPGAASIAAIPAVAVAASPAVETVSVVADDVLDVYDEWLFNERKLLHIERYGRDEAKRTIRLVPSTHASLFHFPSLPVQAPAPSTRAALVLNAVGVESEIAPDPILAAIAAQQVTWDAFGDACSLTDSVLARQEGRTVTAADEALHATANEADEAALTAITLTTPTTVAGAFAALRIIRERGSDDHLDQMLATIIASPIAGGANV